MLGKLSNYTYTDPRSRGLPASRHHESLMDQNEEKASTLLRAFSAPQPEPEKRPLGNSRHEGPETEFQGRDITSRWCFKLLEVTLDSKMKLQPRLPDSV